MSGSSPRDDSSSSGQPSNVEVGSPATMSTIRSFEASTPRRGNHGQFTFTKQQIKNDRYASAGGTQPQQQHPATIPSLLLRRQLPLPTPKQASRCPLFCCFYAEFDNIVGPKVSYQCPPNFMEQPIDFPLEEMHQILEATFRRIRSQTKDGSSSEAPEGEAVGREDCDSSSLLSIFDSCSEYIITGHELTGNIINLSTHNIHILARPTVIFNRRYERNSLLFCVGFVLRRKEDPRPFRPALSKLALVLRDMEMECQFLSKAATRPQIQTVLEHLLISLNSPQWECNLLLSPSNYLNLKLFHPPKLPAFPVPDYAVPILLRREVQVQTYDWDLSINWVSLHIDGITNARQISKKAEVDMEMVRACLRVLKHHGVIALVDMFFYTNRYEGTSKTASLFCGSKDAGKLLHDAAEFVIRRPATTAPGSLSDSSPPMQSTSPPSASSLQDFAAAAPPPCGGGTGTTRFSSLAAAQQQHTHENMSFTIPPARREEFQDVKTAIAELLFACNRNISIGELWISLVTKRLTIGSSVNWGKMFHLIDHRRFTSFAIVHGLLKRVHNYPILMNDDDDDDDVFTGEETTELPNLPQLDQTGSMQDRSRSSVERNAHKVAEMMDGRHCDDELACAFERPFEDLVGLFEENKVVSVFAASSVNYT